MLRKNLGRRKWRQIIMSRVLTAFASVLLLAVCVAGAQVHASTTGPATAPRPGELLPDWPQPIMGGGRLGAGGVPGGPGSPVTPPPTCGLAWRVVSSPNIGTADNSLSGVVALSENDVWAAGGYYDSAG